MNAQESELRSVKVNARISSHQVMNLGVYRQVQLNFNLIIVKWPKVKGKSGCSVGEM